MEKQLSLPYDKIQVYADYREQEIIEILNRLGIKVNVVNLEVGDFVVGEFGIERKSFGDFISSIIDSRIFEQAKKLLESYEKRLLIVEGNGDVERINENSYFAALTFLISKGINVVFSRNKIETAKIIYWLAKKEKSNDFSGFKIPKKKKELKEIQEMIIASFPGISSILSKRILKKFKTIKNFVLASELELRKVDGIGEKLSKKIKKIIETEYEGD